MVASTFCRNVGKPGLRLTIVACWPSAPPEGHSSVAQPTQVGYGSVVRKTPLAQSYSQNRIELTVQIPSPVLCLKAQNACAIGGRWCSPALREGSCRKFRA